MARLEDQIDVPEIIVARSGVGNRYIYTLLHLTYWWRRVPELACDGLH